jgi:1,4-dihydroxy-2-naphthoyl-CoA hydrolase
MISHLGIEFTEISDQQIKATMPVDDRTLQPFGLLHGGAILALMETIGSAGSYFYVDIEKYNVVGMEVNANHVANTSEKMVYGIARILHKGKMTHVWSVEIYDSQDKPLSFGRVTNMILEKDKNKNL